MLSGHGFQNEKHVAMSVRTSERIAMLLSHQKSSFFCSSELHLFICVAERKNPNSGFTNEITTV